VAAEAEGAQNALQERSRVQRTEYLRESEIPDVPHLQAMPGAEAEAPEGSRSRVRQPDGDGEDGEDGMSEWIPLPGERVVWTGEPCEVEGTALESRWHQGHREVRVKWDDGQFNWTSTASLKSGETP
jgi:hypothetical protein